MAKYICMSISLVTAIVFRLGKSARAGRKLDATRVCRHLKGALLGVLGAKSLSLLTLLEVNL